MMMIADSTTHGMISEDAESTDCDPIHSESDSEIDLEGVQ